MSGILPEISDTEDGGHECRNGFIKVQEESEKKKSANSVTMGSWWLPRTRMPRNLLLAAVIHSVFGSSAWYFTSSLNNIHYLVKDFINRTHDNSLTSNEVSWRFSWIAAADTLGNMLFFYPAIFVLDSCGRRWTVVWLKNAVLAAACLLQFACRYFRSSALLFLGRLLAGTSTQLSYFICVYLAECSPSEYRGLVSGLPMVACGFWIAIGSWTGVEGALGNSDCWHWVFLIPLAPCVLHTMLGRKLPDSPKQLYIVTNRHTQAKNAAGFYSAAADKEFDWGSLRSEYEAEKRLGDRSSLVHDLATILKHRHYRWPFFIILAVCWIETFGGLDIAEQYSTEILTGGYGLTRSASQTITSMLIQLPPILIQCIPLCTIDTIGRRPWALLGGVASILGPLLIAISRGRSPLFGAIGLIISKNSGYFGPMILYGLLLSELTPQACRSYVTNVSYCFGYLTSLSLIVIFPLIPPYLVASCFYGFAISNALCLAFLMVFLPETKGKSVTEALAGWVDESDKAGLEICIYEDMVDDNVLLLPTIRRSRSASIA